MSMLGHVNLWTCSFSCTPEGYRKDTVKRPVTRPVDRPVNERKTEAGPETRPAGRIPEGFHTILVMWSPGPHLSPR